MKNFLDDVVLYWFQNVWMLTKDGSWDAWSTKLIMIILLAVTGGFTYLSITKEPSPFAENPFPVFFALFGTAFFFLLLPASYAQKKHYYDGKAHYEEQKRIDKMIEERDANKKPY